MQRLTLKGPLLVVAAVVVVFTGCGGDGSGGGNGGAGDDSGVLCDAGLPSQADAGAAASYDAGGTTVADAGGAGAGDAGATPQKTTITVMTFNVLCSFCNSDYDPWDERLGYFSDILQRHAPDLAGLQELFTADEVSRILELNPRYRAIYFHDDQERMLIDYPDSTILYDRKRFKVLESGFYWLSETPDEPWSSGFAGGQIWRLVAWAHMEQRADGREFYLAATHVDNNSPNQERSAPIILERTAPWADSLPVLVVGDFNSRPDSEAYRILTTGDGVGFSLTDTFDIAGEWKVVTNQEPVPDYDTASRIDHIFVAGQAEWRCKQWVVDMYVYGAGNKYPSDHFPITAELEF